MIEEKTTYNYLNEWAANFCKGPDILDSEVNLRIWYRCIRKEKKTSNTLLTKFKI